ncbi:MAG: type II toxin-antitoxin system RelE/ParE family toxin [Campylobacter sp.]|nr:type II toxin-antitoxin system RelE/ParE family toxin [Campylobacter sp.]
MTKVSNYDNIRPMSYEILWFNDKVQQETLELPDEILATLLKVFDLAREFGANLGRPHSAPLGNGLFEFRVSGKDKIARSVFINAKGKKIVILHSVIKKSNKIPKKDMDLAIKRAKEYKC